MNILKLAHDQITARFRVRVWASLLYYTGLALLFVADWKVGLGVFLVLTALSTMEGVRQ